MDGWMDGWMNEQKLFLLYFQVNLFWTHCDRVFMRYLISLVIHGFCILLPRSNSRYHVLVCGMLLLVNPFAFWW